MITGNRFPTRIPRDHPAADSAEFDGSWDQLGKRAVDFWTSHLAGAPEVLELPSDRPRPAVLGYDAGMVPLELEPELTDSLRHLCERLDVTPFVVLLGAWAALLSRLSGQSDIVIGTPVAVGKQKGTPNRPFGVVNTLPLRVRLAHDPTVSELLAQIRTSAAEAYQHRDIQFAQIVEARQQRRSLSYNPIFQVMLTLDGALADRQLRLPPIHRGEARNNSATAQFDLALSLRDTGERIVGALSYAADLFDQSRIERMATQLRALLESMCEHDEARISELNLLSAAEYRRVVFDWNSTAASFPVGTLPQQFELQVRRTPQAEAVADGTRTYSYADLARATDALAAELQRLGVRPESVVGVAINRSLETVVAAMAILKAGGVYLPLDPAIPDQRLALLLHDAHAALVISDQTLAARLPADVPQWLFGQVVSAGTPSPVDLTPEHLAYIVYTSGSSGTPKGVAVSHASAVNLAHARLHGHDPIGAGDRVLAAISVGFDVSIGQILLPLLSGACVVIAPDLRGLSSESFWAFMAEQRITHVNSVPSFFDSVLDAANHQSGLVLKRLMLGGEALTGALCRRIETALPNTTVINMYGPTEACIDATAFTVPRGVDPAASVLPIGRPLMNYRAYVLDARLQPLPIGVSGELYLGGPGVARGYVGQPQLTASQFIADPFGPPGSRLYRTGDRAMWRADGMLLFLGRRDEQVKIRGFRVEPNEIVAALHSHPSVAQAVVITRTEEGSNRLIAYIVPAREGLTTPQLREHLAQHVPAHMIPAAFVLLDKLPLTPNGKLDRNALPDPDTSASAASVYEAPLNQNEATIVRLWEDLLGVTRVGRNDNFFELGGHSLLVLKLVAALKAVFGQPIPMARVFRTPTPRQLAAALTEVSGSHHWKHLVALNEGSARLPLFCLNGFDGDVDAYLHIARLVDSAVPVYGLEITSHGNRELLSETLESRMASYLAEIRSVQAQGPYHLCGFSFGGAEAFDLACRLEQEGETVVLVLLDAYRPSRWLEFASLLPRVLKMAQSGQLLGWTGRQLRKLVTVREHHWLTGKDRDLEQALRRNAIQREVKPFHGHTILFKSRGIEEWAYPLRLDGFNGWKKFLKGRCDIINIDAEHNALMKEPVVRNVVWRINELLGTRSAP